MFWLLMVLATKMSLALPLKVSTVTYAPADEDVSCGLLRQRERERAKVLREMAYLNKNAAKLEEQRILFRNTLQIDKLFLPQEEWRDASVEVQVTVQVPPALAQAIESQGLAAVFLVTDGPGFVWQSYATQLPADFKIVYNQHSKSLQLSYFIFQTVLCLKNLSAPTVEWIPESSPQGPTDFSKLVPSF